MLWRIMKWVEDINKQVVGGSCKQDDAERCPIR
jgi:hypothetical protein